MSRPFETAKGTFTGTGSAITEATIGSLGFKPTYLVIWNETDGDERFEVIDGLADDKAYQVIDSGSGTTDLSVLASNGVTLSNTGFAVGTSISESGKTYRFWACGGN